MSNAKLVTNVLHETPDTKYTITYSIKSPADIDPVVKFTIQCNATSTDIIVTGTPSFVWNELHKAITTQNSVYRWEGNEKSPIKISAYEKQIMFIYGSGNQIQIKLPAIAGKWFKVAHEVVGEWELRCNQ